MLKDDAEGLAVNDGTDLSLCMIDHANNKLEFAAAQGSALIIQGGELTQLKGSKFSIGGFGSSRDKMFETTSITFNSADLVYMFSDGYQDQFGGMKGKKFYKKNLIHLIESGSDKTMKQQELTILENFVNWKGNEMQMDDVTVMGIRL
jgi:serine phosphatase RsbU (regulator of sigma subunit)